MRFLGIDYGAKRVGIALSDAGGRFAAPYAVWANNNNLIPQILALCQNENVEQVVLGDSRDFSGQANPIMKAAHEFRAQLMAASGLPVVLELEVLTTKAAEWQGASAKRPARQTKAEAVPDLDARAAALILQSYLDRANHT